MNLNKKTLLIITAIVLSFSFKFNNLNKRSFSDENYTYEFYIDLSNKNIRVKSKRVYYWYKSDKIYKNTFGIGGKVLHGEYIKRNLTDKTLLEKGNFKYGLKNGVWKEWFQNGNLAKIVFWKKGVLNGIYKEFDTIGAISLKGHYKNGLKTGNWINYIKKDTIYYSHNIIKEKKTIRATLKSIFNKKNKSKKVTKPKSKKHHFFKKLFQKKTKTKNKKTND